MKKRIILAVIAALLLVGTLFVIFEFSSQNGEQSASLSTKVTEYAARFIYPDYNSFSASEKAFVVENLGFFVRKTTHFSIFAVLGFFTYLLSHFIFKRFGYRAAVTLVICFVSAVADEIHQSMVADRMARKLDIFIDCAGGLFGAIAAFLLIAAVLYIKSNRNVWKKRKNRISEKLE